ncbi:hypothetical protein chiPu_0021824 [Chiloscyllium punctatum]|uniref:Uncharacterized protein n=1 Tax=Chiloscyllium punctatum TaxID=137246 RepID=A0A401RMQ1_CHIPU|nr:hypothetical protein [Chiloscyllium punctatum]
MVEGAESGFKGGEPTSREGAGRGRRRLDCSGHCGPMDAREDGDRHTVSQWARRSTVIGIRCANAVLNKAGDNQASLLMVKARLDHIVRRTGEEETR